MSKVLANRLKSLLNKCISSEQSTFLENRSVTGNALTTFETIIHHMKCKRKGKKDEVALKVDISKAFDKIKWSYPKGILRKMVFCQVYS